jgi:hypothetical protein
MENDAKKRNVSPKLAFVVKSKKAETNVLGVSISVISIIPIDDDRNY